MKKVPNNETSMKLLIDSQSHELPNLLLSLNDLHSLFSYEQYQKIFSKEEQAHLQSYLPTTNSPEFILKSLFSGDKFYMSSNPMDSFLDNLKTGHYSPLKQQEIKLQKQLYNHSILEHFDKVYEELKVRLEDANLHKSLLHKRKNLELMEDLFTEESDQEKKSISVLSLENSFSELSQGYSTPISLTDEPIHHFLKKQQDMNLALLQESRSDFKKPSLDSRGQKRSIAHDSDSLKTSNTHNNNHHSSSNNHSNSDNNNNSILNIAIKAQSSVLNKGSNNTTQSNGKRTTKSTNSKEGIESFRAQENERYSNPTRPYTYICADGSKGIVAPVSKKVSFTSATKPRDHFLLKTERPPYITILCLVRDAASRLPNGFGTRADICELLKESQYINEHVPDDKLSNIVSGALDRLHYEDDACVKYDPEKKLWIYLHKGRTENYPAWMEQNDSRSSKKKEYNQKYKNKRRVRGEDMKTGHKI